MLDDRPETLKKTEQRIMSSGLIGYVIAQLSMSHDGDMLHFQAHCIACGCVFNGRWSITDRAVLGRRNAKKKGLDTCACKSRALYSLDENIQWARGLTSLGYYHQRVGGMKLRE